MNSFARMTCVLILAVLVAGCGVRLAYSNLDYLLMRWIDRQVSLDDQQRHQTRDWIETQLAWHCASELPDYADWLHHLKADVAHEALSVDVLRDHAETLSDFGQRVVESLQPGMIEFLRRLDEDQAEELAESVREQTADLAGRVEMNFVERRRERIDAMRRGLRWFTGRLNRDQRMRLEQWADEFIDGDEGLLTERRDWQARFLVALEKRHTADFDRVVGPLLSPGGNWSEDYRDVIDHNRERTLEALSDIHRLADGRQKRRLHSRIESLGDDFERLSCQPT